MALVGIDLGTTNSLVAVWQNNEVTVIPNALGDLLTPSVVSVDNDGSLLVGKAAVERLSTHPELSVAAFKRRMGSAAEFSFGNKSLRVEELSAIILKQLKEDAERYLNTTVDAAVISVPAYFNDVQRRATKAAAELAGLKLTKLINEPTAAAVAYGLSSKEQEQQFIVLDLGGGTFDVSLMELFDGVMQVHASAGDNFLGGEDFDEVILKAMIDETGVDLSKLNHQQLSQWRKKAKEVKHALEKQKSVTIALHEGKRDFEFTLSMEKFEKLSQALLERFRLPIERVLRDAKIAVSELDNVILVGGSTRMPLIKQMVPRLFKRFPLAHIDPDQVVVRGAAIQAALAHQEKALEDVALTDVCPYTLGTEIVYEKNHNDFETGHFMPIIERNSFVPVSRVKRLYTVADNQELLRVAIYQGESRLVKNNVLLSEIEVKIPAGPAGEQAIDIRYTYDNNGMLEVITTVISTGETQQRVIKNNESSLSDEEIKARFAKLADLKVHPRDDLANRTLLAKAERLYEESLGQDRDTLAHFIQQFELILDEQDPEIVEKARLEFSTLLNEIERDIW